MGVANGSGGAVFDNVTIRAITDDEINKFDHIMNGIDWGWFPDPRAFVRVNYEPAQHRLVITSYSIHYTKLYELLQHKTFRGYGRAVPAVRYKRYSF